MNLIPFNFSNTVKTLDLYQRLCYYHNEANNGLQIINNERTIAMSNLKGLYNLLKKEYNEYNKVKNEDYILSNGIYAQYVSNISDAYLHCININSYDKLSSNLYDVYDYVKYGFEEIFCLDDKNKFAKNNINNYLYKVCCVELKNGNIYVGKTNIKLHDFVDNRDESISIYFLDEWNQIMIDDIDKIKIIKE